MSREKILDGCEYLAIMIEKDPTPAKKFTTHSPEETRSAIRFRSRPSLGEK
jgi:hypothetical protein